MAAPDLYEVPIVTQPVTNRLGHVVCIAAGIARSCSCYSTPGNEDNYAVMQMPHTGMQQCS